MKNTVCVDLDGVLANYGRWQGLEKIGEPLPGAVAFSQQLAEVAHVVIFTTRCNEAMNQGEPAESLRERIQMWLDEHGFAYHQIYTGQGKPHAAAYVDDRAVPCCPQTHGEGEFQVAVDRVKELIASGAKTSPQTQ